MPRMVFDARALRARNDIRDQWVSNSHISHKTNKKKTTTNNQNLHVSYFYKVLYMLGNQIYSLLLFSHTTNCRNKRKYLLQLK